MPPSSPASSRVVSGRLPPPASLPLAVSGARLTPLPGTPLLLLTPPSGLRPLRRALLPLPAGNFRRVVVLVA